LCGANESLFDESADGKKHSLSYICEGWSENSVGGKMFKGNVLRIPLTIQAGREQTIWQQEIFTQLL
jgi:hypothetical protein